MLAVGLACGLAVSSAEAAPREIGKNGSWSLFVDDAGGKSCYIFSTPTAQRPRNLNWDPRFYVMRSGTTGGRLEPSVFAGYSYQEGTNASVSVGSDTFTMFTDKDGAWLADAAQERRLIEAMKAGATMIVKGTSARGNLTTDTYSLSGVTASIKRLEQECPS